MSSQLACICPSDCGHLGAEDAVPIWLGWAFHELVNARGIELDHLRHLIELAAWAAVLQMRERLAPVLLTVREQHRMKRGFERLKCVRPGKLCPAKHGVDR